MFSVKISDLEFDIYASGVSNIVCATPIFPPNIVWYRTHWQQLLEVFESKSCRLVSRTDQLQVVKAIELNTSSGVEQYLVIYVGEKRQRPEGEQYIMHLQHIDKNGLSLDPIVLAHDSTITFTPGQAFVLRSSVKLV